MTNENAEILERGECVVRPFGKSDAAGRIRRARGIR